MNINYSEYSDIGGRSINEDMVQITSYPDCVIAMVADGLGGHGSGDVASRLAVSAISETLRNGAASTTLAEKAIAIANQRILQRQGDDHSSMKTTIAMLWINEKKACVAHVGDTRIYQFRAGSIVFQSKDHSVPQMEVNLGHIHPEQIRGHVDRNRLTRALGSHRDLHVETQMLQVQPGDAFLLCSDGFWELVWEQEMLMALEQAQDAKSWLQGMLHLVATRLEVGADNNTAVTLIVQ